MTFDNDTEDESISHGGNRSKKQKKRRYSIVLDNNYEQNKNISEAYKVTAVSDSPSAAENEIESDFKQHSLKTREMMNKDFKAKGLYFRIEITGGSRRIKCERRYKDFEFLR